MNRNASLEEDNSRLRRESELAGRLSGRLSAVEREVSGLCMSGFMDKLLVRMGG